MSADDAGRPAPPGWLVAGVLGIGVALVSCAAIWAVRWTNPTRVALAILRETVGATAPGWVIFDEQPGPITLAGATVLLMGVALIITRGRCGALPVTDVD